ncbi:MAG TPA: DNA polymerase III subunit beta [Candidatus Kapabacteria bacterium]|jgi:DNA polymerase-3 subunit beta|nr:DNA polymerase III subunit beta [Candidatus Kapabacteria bacterium]HOV92735.1 DNA polymerase III subunit beta [Candidatus Kapabacteria bacterium]
MKFSITIEKMQDILNQFIPIIPTKATIMALQHFHFSLIDNTLKVLATNEEISMLSSYEVEGEENGEILVPAKKLNDIIRVLPKGGSITIDADIDTYEIVLRYNKGKFAFKGLGTDEYVSIPYLFESDNPDIDEIAKPVDNTENRAILPAGLISRIGFRTLFAVSDEEYRPAMTGVLFQFRGNLLTAVSTDGYRMNRYNYKTDEEEFPKMMDVVIPSTTVDYLHRVESEITMTLIEPSDESKFLRFDFDNTILTSRIIREKFPPYETIIPPSFAYQALIPINDLLDTVRRISLSSYRISKAVIFNFSGNSLLVSAENDETGESAEETIQCEFMGEDLRIGVRYDYILQSLQHINEEIANDDMIELLFNGPQKAYIICQKEKMDEFLMLNMPVRI